LPTSHLLIWIHKPLKKKIKYRNFKSLFDTEHSIFIRSQSTKKIGRIQKFSFYCAVCINKFKWTLKKEFIRCNRFIKNILLLFFIEFNNYLKRMKKLPIIFLEHRDHKRELQLLLKFDDETMLLSITKKIRRAKWNKTLQCWKGSLFKLRDSTYQNNF
jgi:hypothetical protein